VLARSLITGRTRIIGLVVAYLDNQFYPIALERLSRALQARGYHILVFMAENSTEGVLPVMQELIDYRVEGIVTASVAMTNDLTNLCEGAGIPSSCSTAARTTRASEVTSDNVAGGRAVADLLVRAGHARIAHIAGWQGASTGRDRARGFLDGLAAHGVNPHSRGRRHVQPRPRRRGCPRPLFRAPTAPTPSSSATTTWPSL
jgi:DNA-binding LacI/PurR family transcriptional regulator